MVIADGKFLISGDVLSLPQHFSRCAARSSFCLNIWDKSLHYYILIDSDQFYPSKRFGLWSHQRFSWLLFLWYIDYIWHWGTAPNTEGSKNHSITHGLMDKNTIFDYRVWRYRNFNSLSCNGKSDGYHRQKKITP